MNIWKEYEEEVIECYYTWIRTGYNHSCLVCDYYFSMLKEREK